MAAVLTLLALWTMASPHAAAAGGPLRSLPLRPAHGDVRAALASGEARAIEDAFARDLAANGEGFLVRRLERSDPAGACARIRTLIEADGPLRDLALPRHLRCVLGGDETARAAAVPALAVAALAGPLGRDARVIADVVSLVERTAATGEHAARALAPLLTMPVPSNEPGRRAAVAAGLRLLALRAPPSTAKAATLRLYDELPEQPRGEVIDDGAMTPPRRIARATVLERLQRNAEVVDVVGDLVDEDCEAALLVAKAKRKLRRYAESRQALAHATHDRCGEIQKKARYLELRVASIQKGDSVESLATSFLKRWGRDPLADDVLLWVAETRAARGDEPGRDEALARIVSDFPDGDMAEDARFRLALAAALRGETARATTMLDDAVAAHTERRRTRIIDRDRARYWRARLAVAPDPRSLNVVADETTAQAGWTALATFARERGASFYGQLARRLLHSAPAAKDGADHAADPAGEARATIPDDAAVGVPAALGADRRFALALTALQAGFDDEAATLLVDVVSDTAFAGDRAAVLAVAAAFVTAGRPDRAHQTLRNAGFALLDGEPVGAGLPAWALAWPRAHAAALEEGATQGRIPPPLLFGIAREESAFDASVVSWAGAVGLCQLMPTTALDEARALKLPPPSTTDLLDPTLNARLGGAHLGRRLHGMKHPLLAIAAYNAGPGAVARWMPPEGQRLPADLFVEQIPVEETRNYVKKVIGSWVTYAVLDGAGDAAVLDEGPLAFDIRIGR